MKKLLAFCALLLMFFGVNAQNTWSKNIAQLTYTNCSPCHNPNGIAPMSLLTYYDAIANKQGIKGMVQNKTMPPWIANKDYQQYAHQRVLTDAQIDMVVNWVDAGAPEGVRSETPPPPVYSTKGYIKKAPDLELKMPVYSSKASAISDDYVCFSVPSGLTSGKKIRAFEVVPGNHALVHHSLVYIDQGGTYKTDTSGGVCTGPTTGLLGGYVPGSPPTVFASNGTDFNLGFEILAGANVVLAMHYPEGSKGMKDSTLIRFWFYDDQINVRQIATASLIENWEFYLPANKVTEVRDDFKNSFGDYALLSVFPHMHLLGKDIKAYGITPTGDTLKLADIPHWDFEWQEFLFFNKIIKLPMGSTLYGVGHYDNTVNNHHNPNDPPIPVKPGLNTKDEMFLIYFHFMQYQSGDENRDIQALTEFASVQTSFHKSVIKVYPNPSKDVVNFEFPLQGLSQVSLRVYDGLGQEIANVVSNQVLNNERNTIQWKIPSDVKSGMYFYSVNLEGNMISGVFLIE